MTGQIIEIQTGDGVAKAGLFTPGTAPRAGVILYMDVFGLRPALDDMAERLVAEGYGVLVPDLFYRFPDKGSFDARTAFTVEETKAQLMGMIRETSQEMTMRDTGAFIGALRAHGIAGPVGTVGYCMGGGRAINAAAAHPDAILAAASFHGGGLASDAPDSPHLRAGDLRARIYVGAAGVDGSFPPEQAAKFTEAMRAAEVDFILENYVGMAHGWAVPDHRVFDEAGYERHWKRLFTFFGEALG